MSFSESSSSLLLAFILATVGGLAVLVGLALEKFSDWLDEGFIGGYKAHKLIGEIGWWVLMLGIVIETGVAGSSAIIQWQNEPLNRPISDISAIVNIRVKGRENVELPPWTNDSPSVADIILCREIVPFTNVLKIGLFFDPTNDAEIHDPSGRPNREAIPVTGFPILKCDKFEVLKSSQFIFQQPDFHEYHMKFHSDSQFGINTFDLGISKVKNINKIKELQIGLKFLPHDSEILQGIAVITVNDTRKIFFISPQKDSCTEPDAPGLLNEFELVTTNVVSVAPQ